MKNKKSTDNWHPFIVVYNRLISKEKSKSVWNHLNQSKKTFKGKNTHSSKWHTFKAYFTQGLHLTNVNIFNLTNF